MHIVSLPTFDEIAAKNPAIDREVIQQGEALFEATQQASGAPAGYHLTYPLEIARPTTRVVAFAQRRGRNRDQG